MAMEEACRLVDKEVCHLVAMEVIMVEICSVVTMEVACHLVDKEVCHLAVTEEAWKWVAEEEICSLVVKEATSLLEKVANLLLAVELSLVVREAGL